MASHRNHSQSTRKVTCFWFDCIPFTESSIFARFSAILRHDQRNAKNLFSYLTKVKVSNRQQIWPNGNVNDATVIMPTSKTITLTFHFGSVCRIRAHDDTAPHIMSNITSCSTLNTNHIHYLLPLAFFYHHLNASKMF